MHNRIYYIVNAITAYRLLAAFVLLYLIITGRIDVFKWLLAFSFFTDFLDGYLARKFKVVSTLGAKLDSIADDLTVLMAIIAVIVFDPRFVRYELVLTIIVFGTYCIQTLMALVRYGRLTGFHTYIAKCAALFQGLFLSCSSFYPGGPYYYFIWRALPPFWNLLKRFFLSFFCRSGKQT
jgi:CDP-diacylglycerol--glycerol-3-phosphate 3-phosphatidyltransferase